MAWSGNSNRGRGRRGGHQLNQPRSFKISEDGETFFYPKWNDIPASVRNPSVVDEFKDSLAAIGYYSEDGEKNYQDSTASLKFINKSQLPDEHSRTKFVDFNLALSVGQTEAFSGTYRKSFLNILHWIKRHKDLVKQEFGVDEESEEAELGPEFIMGKHTLSKIINLPYSFSQDTKFYASSVNGTIYLLKDLSVNDIDYAPVSVSDWSHKFKQYMYGEDVNEPPVCNEDFRYMFKAKIGPFTVLYSASVDGADPDLYNKDSRDLSAFFKLKTITDLEGEDKLARLRRKLIFMFYQCLLTSTPKIIVGYRQEAVITRLEVFSIEYMRKSCEDSGGDLNPLFGFIYATRLLTYVKFRTEAEPGAVFSFTKQPWEPFFTSRKEEELDCILPEWFEKKD